MGGKAGSDSPIVDPLQALNCFFVRLFYFLLFFSPLSSNVMFLGPVHSPHYAREEFKNGRFTLKTNRTALEEFINATVISHLKTTRAGKSNDYRDYTSFI